MTSPTTDGLGLLQVVEGGQVGPYHSVVDAGGFPTCLATDASLQPAVVPVPSGNPLPSWLPDLATANGWLNYIRAGQQ